MFTVEIKEKVNGAWVSQPVPEMLTERIEVLKSYAGKEAVIQLKSTNIVCYLCGNERLVNEMRKLKPTGHMIMTAEDAYKVLQYQTEEFLIAIQCFWSPAHINTVFPPKPITPETKGWEHLKPQGEN